MVVMVRQRVLKRIKSKELPDVEWSVQAKNTEFSLVSKPTL